MPEARVRFSLFDDMKNIDKMAKIYKAVDMISENYGKYTVHHETNLPTQLQTCTKGRGEMSQGKQKIFSRVKLNDKDLGLQVIQIKV